MARSWAGERLTYDIQPSKLGSHALLGAGDRVVAVHVDFQHFHVVGFDRGGGVRDDGVDGFLPFDGIAAAEEDVIFACGGEL